MTTNTDERMPYDGHEGESLVNFELYLRGEETRLKLTHKGLETSPRLPAFARENFTQRWTSLIGTSLKEYLENTGTRLPSRE